MHIDGLATSEQGRQVIGGKQIHLTISQSCSESVLKIIDVVRLLNGIADFVIGSLIRLLELDSKDAVTQDRTYCKVKRLSRVLSAVVLQ